MATQPIEMDSLHVGLARRVAIWAAAVWVAASLIGFLVNRPLGLGLVAGGGVMLAMLEVYRRLASVILVPARRRRSLALFWGVWLAKWPIVGGALYFALRDGAASPLGVALGLGIVPAAATAIVLRTLLGESWRETTRAGAEP
jgi:hypothetical protein